jgi:hypothetical protein
MQDQYSTGKTVYFGGLPNAHSGTLDPSGYIQRSNNQQSERRSGLAAIATARTKQQQMQQSTMPGKTIKKYLNTKGLFVSPTGKIGRLRENTQ